MAKFYVDGKGFNKAERIFRQLPNELKKDLRRVQRSETLPIWREEINARKSISPIAERVYKSGISVKTGANLVLVARGSSRKIGSRRIPQYVLQGAAEFGSKPTNYTKYNRVSPKGKRHTVTRRTRAGLSQNRRTGYVAVPAAKAAVSRIQSLNIQTTMRRIHLAAEGK
ncbi:hypothetical protein ACFUOZ_04670 [Paenarthrobacter sp. NPDC057355]|uniref:hypothetical protein n=1 Tax=Paenarthrobacter sp. NPDC057355 TaxID=3346105 RepID=UPI0036358E99